MKLLLLLLLSNVCLASEAFMGYGVGIFNDASSFIGQNKYAELGYREFVWEGVFWQNRLGYWGEGSGDKTRQNSFWYSSTMGLEVDLQPLEIRGGVGPALISNPDSQLGGYFQFNEHMSIGLRDKKGDGMALDYNHLSCASLCNPNRGRDSITFEMSQKW